MTLLLTLGGALALLLLWLARNAGLRYQRIRAIEARFGPRYSLSAEAETKSKPRMIHAGLKGIRDAQRITWGLVAYDFPFVSFTALEFALFKTYGIPSISSLLAHTGQLGKSENASRRFIDTSVLIGAMMIYPLPPLDLEDNDVSEPGDELFARDWKDPRSAIAISRTNFLHRQWKGKISNDDLLYTLSLFVLEPPEWIKRFEWRQPTALEREALFTVWYHIGRCMGIEGIPDTLESIREWAAEYEATHMVYDTDNGAVAEHTISLLFHSVPVALQPLFKPIIVCLLDERLCEAFGFKCAPFWLRPFITGVLRARAISVRLLMPPRTTPISICPPDAMDRIVAGGGAGGFCPATGISAGEAAKQGKACPVGQHMVGPNSGYDSLSDLTRLQPGWVENTPWYVLPTKAGSLAWLREKLLVAPADRAGAARWQNKLLHSAKGPQGRSAVGFRLEECGPAGHELSGRAEVLAEAVKLNGGKKLTGPWAFQSQVQPVH